jgi:23S rRNA (adenine2503-C2)-methyltransferase
MKTVASTGREDIAVVYILDLGEERLVECVDALQPPLPIQDKWVLLVSTMFGCPVRCKMCDAGGFYAGKLTAEQIFAQIDFLVDRRFPDRRIPSRQFKIQFARMGEPALNPAVLDVIEQLPRRYHAPGCMPSVSTIAPHGAEDFLERLLEIKQAMYPDGMFQFQFSLHTTDPALRDQIIPVRKWSFEQMAEYGERFYQPGDRKITLNFALAQGNPLEAAALRRYFSPEKFLVKITPLNPTHRARQHQLDSYISTNADEEGEYQVISHLRAAGYQVILSIGELEENRIGSNCGQYLRCHLEAQRALEGGYTYDIQSFG